MSTLRDVDRHADLVDRQVGVGRDDGAPREVDALARRLPRKRPCLPLSRCANADRIERFSACHSGRTLGTLAPLRYMAHCSCRYSQSSMTYGTSALPPSIALRMMLLTVMISESLTVRSSSFEPARRVGHDLGRIGHGRTSSSR